VLPVVAKDETRNPPAHVCGERGGWCHIIPILISPCFHPTSSCSWRQLGVLCWWWFSGIVEGGGGGSGWQGVREARGGPISIGTCYPPCEQWLTVAVMGVGLLLICCQLIGVSFVATSSSSSPLPPSLFHPSSSTLVISPPPRPPRSSFPPPHPPRSSFQPPHPP
jgi:hypothetical protein